MTQSTYLEELRRLEHIWQLADAKLQTAQRLGWVVAILAGGYAAYRCNRSGISLGAFAAGYAVSVLPFYTPASKAKDVYFRAAKMGRYARSPFDPEP